MLDMAAAARPAAATQLPQPQAPPGTPLLAAGKAAAALVLLGAFELACQIQLGMICSHLCFV